MLKLEGIHIEEFRGIRKLDIVFKGANFGISGPNGTGKSGVVDAIEFCLTGDVTRLSGRGSADLSVASHAPHVDKCASPDQSKVRLTATIPSLNKKITIERTVENPKRVKITPNDPALLKVVAEIESHPEFALSRREITKYIMTPAGERAKDVQTLLRLEEIEQIRSVLNRILSDAKRSSVDADARREATRAHFLQALSLPRFDVGSIIQAINQRRGMLGLQPINEFTSTTSFRVGEPSGDQTEKAPTLTRATALADIEAFRADVAIAEDDNTRARRLEILQELRRLHDDAATFRVVRQQQLVAAGLELVDSGACPLCDKPWDADDLRAYLAQKLVSAEGVARQLEGFAEHAQEVINALAIRTSQLGRLVSYCGQLQPAIDAQSIADRLAQLSELSEAFTDFVADQAGLRKAIFAFSTQWWTIDAKEMACVVACRTAVEKLPTASKEDQAKHELSIAQERYENSVSATATRRVALARHKRADAVLSAFNASVAEVLDRVYGRVADDFTRFYRALNREDEDEFKAELKFPAPAKLALDVDFYGRGLFPPGAYHSEGHQDGMGLCLYLALMKHTLGLKFTFSVLDDVVMSVDAGHRRELCRLLKREFPHTQFILTTHDRVWLQYMRSEALIQRSQTFSGWSVESGPRIWDDRDIWQEIDDELVKQNVPTAAHYLRRYLEHVAFILADSLRARVEFRGDAQYEWRHLLVSSIVQWRSNLADGLKIATKWKRTDAIARIAALQAKTKDAFARSNAEQWAINRAVHYNEWADLQTKEFGAVAEAFQDLLDVVRCTNCSSFAFVSPPFGSPEAMRCTCGDLTVSLIER